MGIARKLEVIHQYLTPISEQARATGFLANTENWERIDDLTEDIREAILEYRVRALNYSSPSRLTFVLDFIARTHLRRESSAHRESHLLAFRPHGLTDG